MLLDTSGLLCYLDADDARHPDAVTYMAAASYVLTHTFVIAELIALAHVRHFPRRRVLSFVNQLLDNRGVEIVWVDQTLYRSALSLLDYQLDKSYSLCDAISFVLMQQRDIGDALSTDHHFNQAGFRCLL